MNGLCAATCGFGYAPDNVNVIKIIKLLFYRLALPVVLLGLLIKVENARHHAILHLAQMLIACANVLQEKKKVH